MAIQHLTMRHARAKQRIDRGEGGWGKGVQRAEQDYGRGVCYVAAGERMHKAAKKGEGGKERGKEGARGVDA